MRKKIIVALLALLFVYNCGYAHINEYIVPDEVLLELYDGARVADVVDAMVTVGYMGIGVMDPKIAPLWTDVSDMSHRFSGIAVTVRYGPTNRPMHPGVDLTDPASYDDYRLWRGLWYHKLSGEPFVDYIKPGTVIVMDNKDDNDAGSTGSNNIMDWQRRGAVGLVTAGGVRDIDEIILQGNPVYTNYYERGRGERIGRNEVIDVQRPVVVGGALVYPGDVVVADSDGVVVVPRRVAVRVGQIAYQELVDDMISRKNHYEALGRPLDETVIIPEDPETFFKRLGLHLYDASRIDISSENPWYWQYKGETILLLGGSWQDNLFNHPGGLEEHLDVLASVGGNYLRNTMSHRNVGNVFAYERDESGLFDLNRFNRDYWDRFDNFLRLAFERDMIVQIEIWDPWDLYHDHQSFGGWSHHPFNPANNINYTSEESGLPNVIEYGAVSVPTEHPFFRSVPALENNQIVLRYQQAYVDKLLSISLRYPNVLYCMHNETGEKVEFGDYWADYVRQKAYDEGLIIHTSDMRRGEDVRSEDHTHIFDNPDRYTFVDISQNNASLGYGQRHYDNIMFVRERLSYHPRPINNNKNYGPVRGGEETISRMGRMIFAGSAGARFHRPHPHEDPSYMYEESEWGLGLSPRAQKIIKSLRMATDELNMALTEPGNHLLSERDDNEAYLLSEPGRQYALYFPDGGSVVLDMSGASGQWNSRWINLDQAEWEHAGEVDGGQHVRLTAPGEGHWIVVLLPAQ